MVLLAAKMPFQKSQSQWNLRMKQAWLDGVVEASTPPSHRPRLPDSGVFLRSDKMIFASDMFVSENLRGPFPYHIGQVGLMGTPDETVRFILEGDAVDQGIFKMDWHSGDVFVTQPLDREKTPLFQLTVALVDPSDQHVGDPTPLVIRVIDQNDNRPLFSQPSFQGQLPEHAPVGEEVLQLSAYDIDDPSLGNAELRFQLIPPTAAFDLSHVTFDIDPVTGIIITTSNPTMLDREGLENLQHEVVVRVSDMAGGDAGLFTTATVTVTITDINDHPPEFEHRNYELSIPEGSLGPVLNLSISDGDEVGGENWLAVVKVVKGDPGSNFEVVTDPTTNQATVFVVKPLDFETNPAFQLLIRADNLEPVIPEASGSRRSSAIISIQVLDINEAPVIIPFHTVLSKPEGLPAGDRLLSLNATDPDYSDQMVRFSVGHDPVGWIAVDAISGVVTTKATLDRDSPDVDEDNIYTVTILATDNGIPPATGTATLQLELSDENDNAPSVSPMGTWVCEDAEDITTILKASDSDIGTNAEPFSFRLGQGGHNLSPSYYYLGEKGQDVQSLWSLKKLNDTHAKLLPQGHLPRGYYPVPIYVSDSGKPAQTTKLVFNATVCTCTPGEPPDCSHATMTLPALAQSLIISMLVTLVLVL
uniref:cadherin-13-like isoform X2 n=1 Tax=Myxine glutinosa TaxID=7769 RepID=UPI00358EB7AB